MSNDEKSKIGELPILIRDLGVAVAEANQALSDISSEKNNMQYTIQEAEVEMKIVFSETREREINVDGGVGLKFVNFNASYSNKYGFSHESSSSIKIKLKAITLEEEQKKDKPNEKKKATK